jgi:hypothetical protein
VFICLKRKGLNASGIKSSGIKYKCTVMSPAGSQKVKHLPSSGMNYETGACKNAAGSVTVKIWCQAKNISLKDQNSNISNETKLKKKTVGVKSYEP